MPSPRVSGGFSYAPLAAGNPTITRPWAAVGSIDFEGNPAYDERCDDSACPYQYSVGDSYTYPYTPWGSESPVTLTMTRNDDTEWKEFHATLS